MKSIVHVQSYSNWAPANIGPYSQVANAGNFIFLAGQIGFLPGVMVLPKESEEKKQALIKVIFFFHKKIMKNNKIK